MKYITGNIIEEFKTGNYDVLVHGCNCFCTMGSGVAKTIREEWPEVYEADLATRKGDILKLGGFTVALLEQRAKGGVHLRVINAYTQYAYGRGGERYVDYGAILAFCRSLTGFLLTHETILIPKIGAGLGGGDWNVIEGIFDAYLPNRVTCCILEG